MGNKPEGLVFGTGKQEEIHEVLESIRRVRRLPGISTKLYSLLRECAQEVINAADAAHSTNPKIVVDDGKEVLAAPVPFERCQQVSALLFAYLPMLREDPKRKEFVEEHIDALHKKMEDSLGLRVVLLEADDFLLTIKALLEEMQPCAHHPGLKQEIEDQRAFLEDIGKVSYLATPEWIQERERWNVRYDKMRPGDGNG